MPIADTSLSEIDDDDKGLSTPDVLAHAREVVAANIEGCDLHQRYPKGGEPIMRHVHTPDYFILIVSKPLARKHGLTSIAIDPRSLE